MIDETGYDPALTEAKETVHLSPAWPTRAGGAKISTGRWSWA
ncbi:hypothetical protein [Amycolatopsis sp. NPDC021455]